jgi:hypothetical protein
VARQEPAKLLNGGSIPPRDSKVEVENFDKDVWERVDEL